MLCCVFLCDVAVVGLEFGWVGLGCLLVCGLLVCFGFVVSLLG